MQPKQKIQSTRLTPFEWVLYVLGVLIFGIIGIVMTGVGVKSLDDYSTARAHSAIVQSSTSEACPTGRHTYKMTSYSLRDANTGAGYTLHCTVDGPQPGAVIKVYVPKNSSDAYNTRADIITGELITFVIGLGAGIFAIWIIYLMVKDLKKRS